jgi:hypothetical protein
MFKFRPRVAFLAVPAVLALCALSYGSATAMAATSPSPKATAAPSTTAPSTTEPAESATESTTPEVAEPNEPSLPGGGHADPDNVQADTQQEGNN